MGFTGVAMKVSVFFCLILMAMVSGCSERI